MAPGENPREEHRHEPQPPQRADTRRETFPALPPRLKAGDRLGSFRIGREIARGAVAVVYEATDSRHEKAVALKVLSAHLSAVPETQQRFYAEWKLAGRVRHPGIVPVYDRGSARGYSYFAMGLGTGETGAALGPSGARPCAGGLYPYITSLYAAAARSLADLHARGIVHRDVKPENFVLNRDGRLLLCDFGSALDRNERDPRLERSLWGTLGYMSPEQLRPGADPYDPRGDIYAMGVCLYRAVTGASPFPRLDGKALIRWKLQRTPSPPRRLDPHVPLSLNAVIRKAMEARPQLRFQRMDDLACELERFASRKRGSRR